MNIEIPAEGLLAVAARCEQHGAALGMVSPLPSTGGGEPSAAAVRAAHAEVTAAAKRLASRMTSTATALTTASRRYTITDEDNADQIADVVAHGLEV